MGDTTYPDDWEDIAWQVKQEVGWRCQHCGHIHDPKNGYTLTVHHLDGHKWNCRRDNLVALCQRCHLHIQATYTPGQLGLPGFPLPRWLRDLKEGMGED